VLCATCHVRGSKPLAALGTSAASNLLTGCQYSMNHGEASGVMTLRMADTRIEYKVAVTWDSC
jgi:hypothetical protein